MYGRGFEIYSTALGAETPCYTIPPTAYVPASTITHSGVTLITDHVFTRKYDLSSSPLSSKGLDSGAKAGVAVAVLAVAALLVAVWALRRRRKRERIVEEKSRSTYNSRGREDPVLESSQPHELASSDDPQSPKSAGSDWYRTRGLTPELYEENRGHIVPTGLIAPQELPGSTFIHENHPAFQTAHRSNRVSQIASLPSARSAPPSPPDSPPRSLLVSPQSPPSEPRTPPKTTMANSPVVSPLAPVRHT